MRGEVAHQDERRRALCLGQHPQDNETSTTCPINLRFIPYTISSDTLVTPFT